MRYKAANHMIAHIIFHKPKMQTRKQNELQTTVFQVLQVENVLRFTSPLSTSLPKDVGTQYQLFGIQKKPTDHDLGSSRRLLEYFWECVRVLLDGRPTKFVN
jgi:hypothetical protein